ncbi:MAG: tetratricopeptide repeat protein [Thermoanaerobaculia bacterium]|nr:tetratricopeptide repeat protein [Thermoanaerobaculia bacterium]
MIAPPSRRTLIALLALLALAVGAADADPRKRQKEKKKKARQQSAQTQEPKTDGSSEGSSASLPPALEPPAEIAAVSRKLWAWETAEARKALETGDLAGPQADSAWGRVLFQEQRLAEAADRLRAAAAAAKDDPEPLIQLGETLRTQGDSAGATQAFRDAVTRAQALVDAYPGNPRALYHLGMGRLWAGDVEGAVTALEKAREKAPGDPLVHYHLGLARASQERWSDTVAHLDEALKGNDGIALAYYYRGLAQSRLGRKDLMVADLERFLKLAPNSPEAPKARRILGGV